MATKFQTKFLGEENELVYVTLDSDFKSFENQVSLSEFFQNTLFSGKKNWIIDLKDIPFPTTSIMALLISLTVQARIQGGDVNIVSLPQSAKNNFSTFSPLTFLSIDSPMHQIFEATTNVEKEENVVNSSELPQDDVAQAPLVDTFDHTQFLDDETSTIVLDDEIKFERSIERSIDTFSHSKDKNKTIRAQIQVDSSSTELYRICDFIVHHARVAGIKEKHVGKIKISVYEASLNVIEHAYHSQPGNNVVVSVEYSLDFFKIIIRDFGLAFREKRRDEYDVEMAVENRQSGGFGLHIINRSMDDVTYSSDELNGNQLVLIKYLPA